MPSTLAFGHGDPPTCISTSPTHHLCWSSTFHCIIAYCLHVLSNSLAASCSDPPLYCTSTIPTHRSQLVMPPSRAYTPCCPSSLYPHYCKSHIAATPTGFGFHCLKEEDRLNLYEPVGPALTCLVQQESVFQSSGGGQIKKVLL